MQINLNIPLEVRHVVYKWGNGNGGFFFEESPSGFYGKVPFYGCAPIGMTCILVPIDPLTAIALMLVSPEELGYPEGILAAFNLLRGHK
jgi:hypothetical protein